MEFFYSFYQSHKPKENHKTNKYLPDFIRQEVVRRLRAKIIYYLSIIYHPIRIFIWSIKTNLINNLLLLKVNIIKFSHTYCGIRIPRCFLIGGLQLEPFNMLISSTASSTFRLLVSHPSASHLELFSFVIISVTFVSFLMVDSCKTSLKFLRFLHLRPVSIWNEFVYYFFINFPCSTQTIYPSFRGDAIIFDCICLNLAVRDLVVTWFVKWLSFDLLLLVLAAQSWWISTHASNNLWTEVKPTLDAVLRHSEIRCWLAFKPAFFRIFSTFLKEDSAWLFD